MLAHLITERYKVNHKICYYTSTPEKIFLRRKYRINDKILAKGEVKIASTILKSMYHKKQGLRSSGINSKFGFYNLILIYVNLICFLLMVWYGDSYNSITYFLIVVFQISSGIFCFKWLKPMFNLLEREFLQYFNLSYCICCNSYWHENFCHLVLLYISQINWYKLRTNVNVWLDLKIPNNYYNTIKNMAL